MKKWLRNLLRRLLEDPPPIDPHADALVKWHDNSAMWSKFQTDLPQLLEARRDKGVRYGDKFEGIPVIQSMEQTLDLIFYLFVETQRQQTLGIMTTEDPLADVLAQVVRTLHQERIRKEFIVTFGHSRYKCIASRLDGGYNTTPKRIKIDMSEMR